MVQHGIAKWHGGEAHSLLLHASSEASLVATHVLRNFAFQHLGKGSFTSLQAAGSRRVTESGHWQYLSWVLG